MTTRPASPPPPQTRLTPLPDPPSIPRMAESFTIYRTYMILEHRYRRLPDALVSGRGYLCQDARDFRDFPNPDCVVFFNLRVPPAEIVEANGFAINEIGKPPDFVLAVASPITTTLDCTVRRQSYANLKVAEYWCFDRTGGRFHGAPLSGERLTADGRYVRIPLIVQPDGIIHGYSAALGLELCWVEGGLLFWDPAAGEYLSDLTEAKARNAAAKARIAVAKARTTANLAALRQAEAETYAGIAAHKQAAALANAEARAKAAEARVRQLEAALEQCRQAGQ